MFSRCLSACRARVRAAAAQVRSATRASKNVVTGLYRYYWDTWGLTAHTAELGYGRYFGEAWLANTSSLSH